MVEASYIKSEEITEFVIFDNAFKQTAESNELNLRAQQSILNFDISLDFTRRVSEGPQFFEENFPSKTVFFTPGTSIFFGESFFLDIALPLIIEKSVFSNEEFADITLGLGYQQENTFFNINYSNFEDDSKVIGINMNFSL